VKENKKGKKLRDRRKPPRDVSSLHKHVYFDRQPLVMQRCRIFGTSSPKLQGPCKMPFCASPTVVPCALFHDSCLHCRAASWRVSHYQHERVNDVSRIHHRPHIGGYGIQAQERRCLPRERLFPTWTISFYRQGLAPNMAFVLFGRRLRFSCVAWPVRT
jgi:hypothetical protein